MPSSLVVNPNLETKGQGNFRKWRASLARLFQSKPQPFVGRAPVRLHHLVAEPAANEASQSALGMPRKLHLVPGEQLPSTRTDLHPPAEPPRVFPCPCVSASEGGRTHPKKAFCLSWRWKLPRDALRAQVQKDNWMSTELKSQKPCVVRMKLAWNFLRLENCSSFLKLSLSTAD